MRATIFDLGRGIGVAHLTDGENDYVAELNMDGLRVLPQSVRQVREISQQEVSLDDEPTDQDRVDRMWLAIARLRGRLAEFDATAMSRCDATELHKQARELALEVTRLTGGAPNP